MNRLIVTLLGSLFVVNLAWADCAATAAEKKLAGAAKTSFMKKCEKDSAAPAAKAEAKPADAAPANDCAAKAAEKKLAGAAKNSFMKKCEKDAAAPAKPEAKAAK